MDSLVGKIYDKGLDVLIGDSDGFDDKIIVALVSNDESSSAEFLKEVSDCYDVKNLYVDELKSNCAVVVIEKQ